MKFIDSEMPWLDAIIEVKFCQGFHYWYLLNSHALYTIVLCSLYGDGERLNHERDPQSIFLVRDALVFEWFHYFLKMHFIQVFFSNIEFFQP